MLPTYIRFVDCFYIKKPITSVYRQDEDNDKVGSYQDGILSFCCVCIIKVA